MRLLIGYGNTLRMDDGVGPHIASLFMQKPRPEIQVIAAHQLLPEFAATIAQAEGVVFVDASIAEPPGCVQTSALRPLPGMDAAHALMPAGLLALSCHLYGRCPPAYLVTVTGGCFELGEGLTPPVLAALPAALAAAARLLDLSE